MNPTDYEMHIGPQREWLPDVDALSLQFVFFIVDWADDYQETMRANCNEPTLRIAAHEIRAALKAQARIVPGLGAPYPLGDALKKTFPSLVEVGEALTFVWRLEGSLPAQ
jgi:hypothetical protein